MIEEYLLRRYGYKPKNRKKIKLFLILRLKNELFFRENADILAIVVRNYRGGSQLMFGDDDWDDDEEYEDEDED